MLPASSSALVMGKFVAAAAPSGRDAVRPRASPGRFQLPAGRATTTRPGEGQPEPPSRLNARLVGSVAATLERTVGVMELAWPEDGASRPGGQGRVAETRKIATAHRNEPRSLESRSWRNQRLASRAVMSPLSSAAAAMVANGSMEGRRASVAMIVSAVTTGSTRPAAVTEASSRRPDHPLATDSSQRGATDGVHPPVGVHEDDAPARAGHPHQFGERSTGLGDVLQDPLAVGGVEARRGHVVEAGDVAEVELDRQRARGAATGFGEHGLAGVDAHDRPVRLHARRQVLRHVPRAAAGVDHPVARPGRKEFDGTGPKPSDGRERRLGVQGVYERGCVGVLIDGGEARLGCGVVAHGRVPPMTQPAES
jgi:hypothetical protein